MIMSAFDNLFSNDIFDDTFGASVTYSRGALEATFSAMDSIIGTDAKLEYGANLNLESREFVFKITDLKFNGIATYPVRSDLITDASGNKWILQNIGSQPCAEIDADRDYYRVRTVRVDEE